VGPPGNGTVVPTTKPQWKAGLAFPGDHPWLVQSNSDPQRALATRPSVV
jgi:hypothetical protein